MVRALVLYGAWGGGALTAREASQAWGLTMQTVRNYIRKGWIEAELREDRAGTLYYEILTTEKPMVKRGPKLKRET